MCIPVHCVAVVVAEDENNIKPHDAWGHSSEQDVPHHQSSIRIPKITFYLEILLLHATSTCF